jgi:hypothetical protein
MKYVIVVAVLLSVTACNNNTPVNDNASNEKIIINHDTVAETRTTVNTKPVATYSEKVEDALNDWKFAVDVFETKLTFHYLVKVRYEETFANDTLKIPNYGAQPTIEIHKGNDKYSCIIGFLDKNKTFKEYKLVAAKNGQLQIKTLKHYGVYSTSQTIN